MDALQSIVTIQKVNIIYNSISILYEQIKKKVCPGLCRATGPLKSPKHIETNKVVELQVLKLILRLVVEQKTFETFLPDVLCRTSVLFLTCYLFFCIFEIFAQ